MLKLGSIPAISNQDDGIVLKTLALSAVLILLLLFFLVPSSVPPVPVPIQPTAPPMSPALRSGVPCRVVMVPVQPKTLGLSDIPSCPPFVETTVPTPCPTPAGGGILRKIVFASNRADGRYYQLYMMDADGQDLERLTESKAFDRDPHFSYDGKLLAFSSNRENGIYQIFVMDLETRAIRQLTSNREDKTNPFWSPDGRKILYTLHRNSITELGIMNADGSEAHQIANTGGDSHGYGFSPDGRFVSYESTFNKRNELFVLDVKNRKPKLLLETDALGYRGDPVFSPRGDRMVFSSDVMSPKLRQLYIYDLDWNKYYPVTHDTLDKDDPVFSPDGSMIAYVARWENAWNIFTMSADGSNVRNLPCNYHDNIVPTWR